MSTFPVSPDTSASAAPEPQPGRWRLFLPIVSLTLLVLGLLWAAVLLKAQAEEEVVIRSINTENLNLARAFEEHSVRTIKSVDQTVLFLKHQYERYGDRVDIAEYVREGMIINARTASTSRATCPTTSGLISPTGSISACTGRWTAASSSAASRCSGGPRASGRSR